MRAARAAPSASTGWNSAGARNSGNHGVGDHVRRRGGELHAPSGAIAVEAVRDMEVLLEVVLEREVEERRSGRRELHAGREAALHEGQIAGGEMAVEVRARRRALRRRPAH